MADIRILRTPTADKAPTGGSLAPGALAVEMASAAPRLWVGVDPALGYAGNLRLVVDSAAIPSLPLSVANGGIPAGGAQYQVLGKTSGTDRAVAWQTVGERPNSNTAVGGSNTFGIGLGTDNVAIGDGVLTATATTSAGNTSVGNWSSYYVNGSGNTAVGESAIGAWLTGAVANNTAVGASCLLIVAGSNNVAIGANAGPGGTNRTINNGTFVGYQAGALATGSTNEIVIGAEAVGRGSNTVTLGTDAITQLWCGGQDILAATAPNQFLPLAGGTLTTVTGLAGGGSGLTITNTNASVSPAAITINQTGAGRGIHIETNAGRGINIAAGGSSSGLVVDAWGVGNPNGIYGIVRAGIGINLAFNNDNAADGILIGTVAGVADKNAIRLYSSVNGNNIFVLRTDGTVTVGNPTGTAVTGIGTINVRGGYYVNGVAIGAGIAEPSTAGNFLRTDTGTWVAGLPLAGGTLVTLTDATDGTSGLGLTITNASNWNIRAAIELTNVDSDSALWIDNLSGWGTGITIKANAADAQGITIDNSAASSTCLAINNRATSGYGIQAISHSGSSAAIQALAWQSNTTALEVRAQANVSNVTLVNIVSSGTLHPSTTSLRVSHGLTEHFVLPVTGTVGIGAPTGPAVTGAGNVNVSGDYYVNGVAMGAPSDPDLKADMRSAPSGALDKVRKVPVFNFRWQDQRDNRVHIGFSAIDVQRELGEDIGCTVPGKRNYSLPELTAVLWQAVQEMAAEIDQLKRGRLARTRD